MSPISRVPKATFSELFHSVVCRHCPSAACAGVVAPMPPGATAGATGGARGTQFLFGGAREGQEKGGLPLVCVLL